MPGATQVVIQAVEHINATQGTTFGVGIQVGGDALLLGVNGRHETLADFEAVGAALATDEEFQAIVQSGDGLFAPSIEDTIWKSRIAAGEPGAYALVSTANIVLTRVSEAMTFAAEIAATVSEIIGKPAGLLTAVTGNSSRVLWIGSADSLAEIEDNNETLENSPEYVDMFKRSEGLIVLNSLEQTIWQRISS